MSSNKWGNFFAVNVTLLQSLCPLHLSSVCLLRPDMGSGCCKRRKRVEDEDEEDAPITDSDPLTDPHKEDPPKFILVKSNDNSEILPLKKRYRYETEDLEDILNGTITLVKTPSRHIKSNSTQANGVHQNGVSKTSVIAKDFSQENGTTTPHTPYRSRSYSPRKDNISLEKKKSPRKRSESNNNGEVKSRHLKNSVSFEDNATAEKNGTVKNISVEKGDILEKNIKNLEHQINVRNSSDKNSSNSKKNKNDSLINNPETNPMNPLDKDLNILETIKYYLDSVKQNNYNEARGQALQVKGYLHILHSYLSPTDISPKMLFILYLFCTCTSACQHETLINSNSIEIKMKLCLH